MSVRCPKCGEPAAGTSSGKKAFCVRCGWNTEAAAASLRTEIQGFWGAASIGVVLALVAWARGPIGLQGALMIGSAFVLFPLCFGLLASFRLRKVRRLSTKASADGGLASRLTETPSCNSSGEDDIASTLPPRHVRLNWRGWLYSFGIGVLVVFLLFLLKVLLSDATESFGRQPVKDSLAILVLGWYSWLCIKYVLDRWTEWDLLAGGRFARGVVLKQEVPWRSLPRIVYCFRDVTGHEFHNRMADFSHGLYEQMSVTVFYKEEDPTQSVALEGSIFRIG